MTPAEVERLGTHGWFTREDFPGSSVAARIAAERADAGLFRPAGLADRTVASAIRGDALLWVDQDPAFAELHQAFEALREELNRDAWLGLGRFELQLACYSGNGERYLRHRDALADRAESRRVTAIVYLNPSWTPADGGELVLHAGPEVLVEPRLGHSVIFLAAKVEHEVLPAQARRLAATAWYYRD